MRLGISSPLKHKSPREWADNMANLHLTSVVFPVDYTADESVIDAYAEAAREKNLLIAEVGAWCNPISPDKETAEKAMERCIGQLKLADRLHANCCVNVAGSAGARWDGAYRENFSKEQFEKTVRSIRHIIDEAAPENTFYTIEPMPWMIPKDPDQYLELMDAVNRNKFAVHMDIVNWITSPEKYFENELFMDECFAKLGTYIKSCHLKNCFLREEFTLQLVETSCKDGKLNLKKYISLANAANPEMPMIIEHLSADEEYINSVKWLEKCQLDAI